MYEFMERTSITHDDLNNLGVIHISGTKGKGSTSAYCESILRHEGFKTGFYSSPHLMEVRERFRVNGKPVSKERFCQMFWSVYQRLSETKEKYGGNMPRVFSFNTLLACHIFREEQVDAFIMEVGIGGEYDQTNLVQKPAVCGVTSLDIDHTDVLGDTIESIAWHKAGIFKYSTPAVTSPQIEKALEVLKNRSIERQCTLFATQPLAEEYDHILTIHGPKQRINAGLALQICKIWNLKRQDFNANLIDMKIADKTYHGVPVLESSALTPVEIKGLSECKWYGRNQVVNKPGITYYLDGAHTNDSMEQCANWFKATSKAEEELIRGKVVKILFFNVTGERNVPALISYLKPCNFDIAAFSPNKRYSDINRNRADEFELSNDDEMKQIQSQKCKREWDRVSVPNISHRSTDISSYSNESDGHFSEYFPCITDALMWITHGRDEIVNSMTENEKTSLPSPPSIITKDTHLQILVTGSLHLVGGVLLQICPGLND